MAITFTNLGASAAPDFNDPADLSSYSNSSWTPPTSGLILLFVFSRATSGTTNQPTVSGNGLTWTNIATSISETTWRITLFGADASGSSAGATTIAFGGQTQFMCRASFFLAEGVDLSGGVAAAFVQAPTNSHIDAQTSGSVTLSAAGAADNRPIAGFAQGANQGQTPRTNWDEMDDLAGAFQNSGLETQSRDDAFETTASASWATAVPWAGIAAELKAEVSGGTVTFAASATGASSTSNVVEVIATRPFSASITGASTTPDTVILNTTILGTAYGEASPTNPEHQAASWATFSDGAGGSPTITGDPDYGLLNLESSDAAHGPVVDFTNQDARIYTLTKNMYGSGSGESITEIRGDTTVFTQDAATPSWETYSAPINRSWRYVQLRLRKA